MATDVTIDVTQRIDLLFHQYRNSTNLRAFIGGILQLLQDEIADPLMYLEQQAGVDDAEGVWLDLLGDRLGFRRPGILDTEVDYFGFYDSGEDLDNQPNLGFDAGPLFTEEGRLQVRLPLGDEQYRNLLQARGLTLRSRASRGEIEAVLDLLFEGDTSVAEVSSGPGFALTVADSRRGYITVVTENADALIPRQAGHPHTIATAPLRAPALTAFDAESDFTGLFSTAMLGSSDGLWLHGTGVRTTGTGPGDNNTLAFMRTETSGSQQSEQEANEDNGIAPFDSVPTGADRVLRLRVCIQGAFGDGREGLVIESRPTGGAWTEAGFIHGWGYSDSYTVGDPITDEDGVSRIVVADGGWIDVDIDIPDAAAEVRLAPEYIFVGGEVRHDIAVRSITWDPA